MRKDIMKTKCKKTIAPRAKGFVKLVQGENSNRKRNSWMSKKYRLGYNRI